MQQISTEIDEYNAWMREYCSQQGIPFVDGTAITRNGLSDPSLAASDALHPSGLGLCCILEHFVESGCRVDVGGKQVFVHIVCRSNLNVAHLVSGSLVLPWDHLSWRPTRSREYHGAP